MFDWYRYCLRFPGTILLIGTGLLLAGVSQVRYFGFDASSDTLVVQGDPKLQKYNEMSNIFGGDDFVVLTYARNDVLSKVALEEIAELQLAAANLSGVKTTYSILDAPLMESPPVPLERLAEDYRTLRSPDVDLALARAELTTSPMISDYLIARNAESTAISIVLVRDEILEALGIERDRLRLINNPGDEDRDDLVRVESEYQHARENFISKRESLISRLHEIKRGYPGSAILFLSGVPMIAADMLSYVKSDLIIFGSLVLVLIVVMLVIFFRRPRWVIVPLVISVVTIIETMGLLGAMRTPVTVVSSNFISLLAIISISFSIHLIVRYRELLAGQPELDHFGRVVETMRSKFAPCLYTALTTLVAFGSMLGSRIVPIEDFGWMMCLGIVISLLVTYTIFPTMILLLGPGEPGSNLGESIPLTNLFQKIAIEHSTSVLVFSAAIVLPALYGASLVNYDNRFSDYFDEDTQIHRGMAHIDQHLGGTLPLDVYIRFEQFDEAGGNDEYFGFDEETEDSYPQRYWFTPNKLVLLAQLQTELEKRVEIGKVISLSSIEQMARRLNDDQPLNGVEIAYILGQLPLEMRRFLIEPYANPELGWIRLNARITESTAEFSKNELINSIEHYAINTLGIAPDDVIVTGMVVLFNDMLQQLAESQLRTLTYVTIATFLMFSVLLRSIQLAIIALIPNVIAALLIVAWMGYSGIAMDLMTVTIAAIIIGIGVDDAIHYLHRFREELKRNGDVRQAVERAHQTIGRAMYFTTMTVIGGFSILGFSNFIPTVNFGLLTALAMALALIANMVVLPAILLIFYRPAGIRESS